MAYIFSIGILLLVFLLIASLNLTKTSKLIGSVFYILIVFILLASFATFFKVFLSGKIGFVHPYALFLTILPFIALLIYTLRVKTSKLKINYSLTHLQIGQSSFRVILTRWLPQCMYTCALALLLIAFARPVTINKTVIPPTEGIDIMLVLDVSASMQKQDFNPSRFVAAQQTATRFISQRMNDRIGIVIFAKNAMLQAPLTLDYEALKEYISNLFLGIIDPSMTAIGDALAVATSHLKDSKAKSKVIILLTDGDSNAGTIDPLLAAKAAATYGIKVYTIGTASTPSQTPYSSQQDEINEGLLLEVAELTNGKFYRAKNELELKQIYDKINELEKTKFESNSFITRQDIYQPFLLLALCCVLVAFSIEKLFLIKVP